VPAFSQFDPATQDLLCRVHHAASLELEAADSLVGAEIRDERGSRLTRQLLAAANTGEQDFERLKACALEGI
jgi:hypothetical protein